MQTIAHPQMVLVTHSSGENDQDGSITKEVDSHVSKSGIFENMEVTNSIEQSNDCDILLAPRLLDDSENFSVSGGAAKATLDGVQQVVVLAHCLLLKEGARDDDLQSKFHERSVFVYSS